MLKIGASAAPCLPDLWEDGVQLLLVSATFSCYCSGCLLSVSRISSEHNLAGTAVIPDLSSRLTEPDVR